MTSRQLARGLGILRRMIHGNYFEEHRRSIWRRQIAPGAARRNDNFQSGQR
ncbi:hypothetical protein [Nostoc sp.]|uniref:hypothetical protein n=1 Tax=Nostoc sp. TaxID=1180 RepID=UPI0002EC3430